MIIAKIQLLKLATVYNLFWGKNVTQRYGSCKCRFSVEGLYW